MILKTMSLCARVLKKDRSYPKISGSHKNKEAGDLREKKYQSLLLQDVYKLDMSFNFTSLVKNWLEAA